MPVTVTRADATDLDALTALFDGYRQFYRQPADPDGVRSFMADRLSHGDSVIFVAEDDESGATIGFTQLYPIFSSVRMRRVWVLNDLFVAPEGRRRGAAKALMEAACTFAQASGAHHLELATERDNVAAQALYDALGYERDTDFYHYSLTTDSAT